MISGIYVIKHIDSGRAYVGSSAHMEQRWGVHRSALRHNRHVNPHLQAAWNKYGAANFTFRILEECPSEQLAAREQHWMDALQSVTEGFNLAPYACSTRKTDAQRLSASHRWDDPAFAARHSQRIRETLPRKFTPEQIITMRQEYAAGTAQIILAARYGCTEGYVSKVVNGRTYPELPLFPRP